MNDSINCIDFLHLTDKNKKSDAGFSSDFLFGCQNLIVYLIAFDSALLSGSIGLK